MHHSYRKFSTRLSILLLLFSLAGCNSDGEKVSVVHDNYKFDPKVIAQLPLYDSLVAAILEKMPVFQKIISKEKDYQVFMYRPDAEEIEVFTILPTEVGTDVGLYFNKLGKNFISGFDIFKDSSIKIHIRNLLSEKKEVDIEEYLSYYIEGKKIRKRAYPVRDSMLNKHWQYWTNFDEEDPF